MTRALIMFSEQKERLAEIKSYAESNPYSQVALESMERGVIDPIGQRLEHIALIPMGFAVVFSISELKRGVFYRHLSVSVSQYGDKPRWPNQMSVSMIAHQLGFEINKDMELAEDTKITPSPGGASILHVAQPVKRCEHTVVSKFPELKCAACGRRGVLNPEQAKKFVDLLKKPPVPPVVESEGGS